MFAKLSLATMAFIIFNGMVGAGQVRFPWMENCPTSKVLQCNSPIVPFKVPRPSFCPCPVTPQAVEGLLIAGCVFANIFLFAALLIVIFGKTCGKGSKISTTPCEITWSDAKESQWVFGNLCVAHLLLFIFFVSEVTTGDGRAANGRIALCFFVDYFFTVAAAFTLADAAAICRKAFKVGKGSCSKDDESCCWNFFCRQPSPLAECLSYWLLPLLKLLILGLVDIKKFYGYDCGGYIEALRYFPAHLISIGIATVLLIVSVVFFCQAKNDKDKKRDKETAIFTLIYVLSFFIWAIYLVAVKSPLEINFSAIFFVFGVLHALFVLVRICESSCHCCQVRNRAI